MSRERRQFTREFKLEAVRKVEDSDKPLTQVARERGIGADLLYSWKRKLGKASSEDGVFSGNGVMSPEAEEIRRLRRRLQEVEQGGDFLKKASAYFARESK